MAHRLLIGWLVRALVALALISSVAFAAPTQRTAVFAVGHQKPFTDSLATAFVNAGMYAPVMLRERLLGRDVTWHSNATRRLVIDTLETGAFDNVVFVGHGSQDSFWALDDVVTSADLKGVPKLSGECIQHTCGAPHGEPLRDVLLAHPERSFHHHRVIGPIENMGRAFGLLATTLLRRPTLGSPETTKLELR